MSINKTNCPDLKTAALGAFTCLQKNNMPALETLSAKDQVDLVQMALCNAFNAQYGPLILDKSDLDQIHASVLHMQKSMAQSLALSKKWEDKSQIEPPKHLDRFPFPEEMEDVVCMYLFAEGFQSITPRKGNNFAIWKDVTLYDFEAIIFEALDQQCLVYNIEPDTLEQIKQAVYKRHNDFIKAQRNADPRLLEFSTEDLTPS